MASSGETTAARRQLADEPSEPGDQPAVVGRLQRLCRAASHDLPAFGVGVSVLFEAPNVMSAAASSPASAAIEELQFALGEGPCLDAVSSQRPVLVADLAADGAARWPGYTPAAHSRGVRAVFAFPLRVGRSRLGALDVYLDRVGALSQRATARAVGYADVAVETIVEAHESGEMISGLTDAASQTRFEVYQAQGMVMVQLGVTADEALSRLRGHAFAHDRPLLDVAQDVIARRLRLESDEPGL